MNLSTFIILVILEMCIRDRDMRVWRRSFWNPATAQRA